MNGQYAYTPQIWPSVLTVLLLITLCIYSWRHRSVPGALPFAMGCAFAVLWAAGFLIAYAAVDLPTRIFWTKFQALWQLPVATAVTCFILEYAWPGRWLTRRNLALLSFPCLIAMGLMITNDLHHLIWSSYGLIGSALRRFGLGSWILIAYTFVILEIVNLLVLAWLFRRSPQHRWPVVFMLAGETVSRALYLLERANILPAVLPLGMLGMAFSFLAYGIALFGFRLFDPIPLALRTVVEQLHAGMLVLDPQERVKSMNTSAERFLVTPRKDAKGRPVRELLPAYSEVQETAADESEIEFSQGKGEETCYYNLTISRLRDFRRLEVGSLLLLRDVTEQKRAQLQIMKQQQVLATLNERERMARELHDSLGQTLAATHLQASAARALLAQGETAQADECLKQMADMTIAAEADVREYLLGVKTVFSADRPFFESLRQYVARFSRKYGLRVELNVLPRLEAHGLGQEIEVQFTRIIQEALSNSRKHARAQNIQVAFTVVDSRVQIAITDDGQGFDPAAVTARQAEGFGLQAMRERAESLGGSLEILSQPGLGTKVIVHAPIQREAGRGEKVK